MNIYEKLQTIRVALQKEPLKKSGKNEHLKSGYFELGDFLPKINELMLENKLTSNVSFGIDMAVLTLIDIEKPDSQIVFTSPMSEAQLRNCHAVQNLGAVQTYLRRYLYVNAFEIIENDALDSTIGKDKNDKPASPPKTDPNIITDSQRTRLFTICNEKGISQESLKELIKKYGYDSSKSIKKVDYPKIEKDLDLIQSKTA